jgi:MoaA/NifB/PqqE/SkfB family radical SAM enzyme
MSKPMDQTSIKPRTESQKPQAVRGLEKWFILQWMKFRTFFHYLPQAGKLGWSKFFRFIRRLLYFLKTIKKNKFLRFGKKIKMDLYIPYFPSPAFWQAADKFKVFDEKLPCTTVLLSITKACRFHCEHCYQRHDLGADTPAETLAPVIQELQNQGIAFFNIEGGDPFLRYEELTEVCGVIDDRSEIWVNSTGDSVTAHRLMELKTKAPLTSLMFSMHSPEKELVNKFMRSGKAWSIMEEGIAACHQAGIAPSINTCIQRDGFFDGSFEGIMEEAKKQGVLLVQIIHPKPAGGWLNKSMPQFSAEDVKVIKAKINQYNHHKAFRDYPAIYAQLMEEDQDMYGCTAGGTDRFYINAKGDVQPCEFLHLSFGNIKTEPFQAIYQRMRDSFPSGHEDWLCEKYADPIAQIMREEGLTALPLSPELSRKVIDNWDRGEETKLYKKVQNEL